MILVEDFFNKVVNKIDSIYFPDVEYFRDNKNCANVHYLTELFNNGCIEYKKYLKQISKKCKDSESNLHNIISEFIVNFN